MKSLYKKFLLGFLIIMITIYGLLTYSLDKTIEGFFIKSGYDSLINQSENIQGVVLNSKIPALFSKETVIKEMENLERHFGSQIWLIDREGYVYVSNQSVDTNIIENELKLSEVEAVFSGEIIKRQGLYTTVSKEPVITVGYPIYNKTGDVMYAMFGHDSIPGILETSRNIFTSLVKSIGFAIVIAAILIFVFSRRLIFDIQRQNKVVKSVSKGDYHLRINDRRQDELGELARNTNKMVEKLSMVEEDRRRFISNVSHDIRSPLTNIIGYTNGMIDGSLTGDDYVKSLKIIHDESQRLLMLSNSILDLAYLQRQEVEIEKTPVNIEAIILNLLDANERRVFEKKIELKFKMLHDQVVVSADRVLITRALNNLIDNALKYIDEKGVLEINSYVDKDRLMIVISNTGELLGLPNDDIWDRFTKVDTSRGANKNSFGLGLSIVKEILEKHNENIRCYYDDIRGICFELSLKISKEKEIL